MERTLIFLDLSTPRSIVQLPPTFEGRVAKLSILYWDFEGLDFAMDLNNHITGPFYATLKMGDLLRGKLVSNALGLEGIPLPLCKFDGWSPDCRTLTFPITVGRIAQTRFSLDVLVENTEVPLSFTRMLLWMAVETENSNTH